MKLQEYNDEIRYKQDFHQQIGSHEQYKHLKELQIKNALKYEKPLYAGSVHGSLSCKLPELEEQLSLGLSCLSKTEDNFHTLYVFYNQDVAVYIDLQPGEKEDTVLLSCSNEAEYDKYKTLLKFLFTKNTKKGQVNVLAESNYGGITTTLLGSEYASICRDNYTETVLKAYDSVLKEFNSENSQSSLGIFSGLPGTGKTFLLRSLIGEIQEKISIYIPASMTGSLSEPKLLSALMQTADKNPGKKILLILEDADAVLAPRAETDISGISSLLNLADGMLGNLLKIKILATTNAASKAMDKAILRPGRLTAHAVLDKLEYDQALKIYQRIHGTTDLKSGMYTLGELYNPRPDIIENKSKFGFR